MNRDGNVEAMGGREPNNNSNNLNRSSGAVPDLHPLPVNSTLPPLPRSDHCEWSFDATSRVLLANFRKQESNRVIISKEDEKFLLTMMERDDITVISDGLANSINFIHLQRKYMENSIGTLYHHKVKEFIKTTSQSHGLVRSGEINGQFAEKGWEPMKVSDFFNYLDMYQQSQNAPGEYNFTFKNIKGIEKKIDVRNHALYLLDLDIPKLLPKFADEFTSNFMLPGILPGGSHCMMNPVNATGRPFMGPNLYMTTPSSFTHFHQDGNGTVDSGHFCYSGYNEVVMLRRLPEEHKLHALILLNDCTHDEARNILYGKPHDKEVATSWPTTEAIDKCKDMGYSPSVFILKPGQHVHINKGRLHAFRKLSKSKLHENDCHYELRRELLPSIQSSKDLICSSVAWDWMFTGVTSEGINREVSSMLECTELNQAQKVQSLAIPETALLFLARHHVSLLKASSSLKPSSIVIPESLCVLQGILPSLKHIIEQHRIIVEAAKKTSTIHVCEIPDAQEHPDSFPVDPYGCSDNICRICSAELSNIYMHCDGCETLLSKDFNICSSCHSKEEYKVNIKMNPCIKKMKSTLHHMGLVKYERTSRCPCKNGPQCGRCNFCMGCSCTCHQDFTRRYRFMTIEDEVDLVKEVELAVGAISQPTSIDMIKNLNGNDGGNDGCLDSESDELEELKKANYLLRKENKSLKHRLIAELEKELDEDNVRLNKQKAGEMQSSELNRTEGTGVVSMANMMSTSMHNGIGFGACYGTYPGLPRMPMYANVVNMGWPSIANGNMGLPSVPNVPIDEAFKRYCSSLQQKKPKFN